MLAPRPPAAPAPSRRRRCRRLDVRRLHALLDEALIDVFERVRAVADAAISASSQSPALEITEHGVAGRERRCRLLWGGGSSGSRGSRRRLSFSATRLADICGGLVAAARRGARVAVHTSRPDDSHRASTEFENDDRARRLPRAVRHAQRRRARAHSRARRLPREPRGAGRGDFGLPRRHASRAAPAGERAAAAAAARAGREDRAPREAAARARGTAALPSWLNWLGAGGEPAKSPKKSNSRASGSCCRRRRQGLPGRCPRRRRRRLDSARRHRAAARGRHRRRRQRHKRLGGRARGGAGAQPRAPRDDRGRARRRGLESFLERRLGDQPGARRRAPRPPSPQTYRLAAAGGRCSTRAVGRRYHDARAAAADAGHSGPETRGARASIGGQARANLSASRPSSRNRPDDAGRAADAGARGVSLGWRRPSSGCRRPPPCPPAPSSPRRRS